MSRLSFLRGILALLMTAVPFGSLAHSPSVAHVDITVPAGREPVRIELDVAIRDLALSLPVDRNRDERVTWGELVDAREDVERLVLDGIVVSASGVNCELEPTGLATRRYEDGAYLTVLLDAVCPRASALRLDYRLLRDRDPQHRALVTLRRDGRADTAIAGASPVDFDVALAGRHVWRDYLQEGIRHILIGYDHIAFLMLLLLPAALSRVRGGWQPDTDWRRSIRAVLGIVTAFTAAHSVTLSLAALGWVDASSRWVEPAIAASVLVAALNNLRPVVTRKLWLVGFGFGLLHGFGFAGALGELGLPDGERLAALLSFNIGVEAGQLALVAVTMPVVLAVRGRRWYANGVMPLISAAIAVLAAVWLWQRL